jgi:hypothetical protein
MGVIDVHLIPDCERRAADDAGAFVKLDRRFEVGTAI